jgi:hypothetical protein
MTKWAGATRVDIERSGIDVPNGVGTIRALKSWHGTIREEITGFEPERRMIYKGLSGVPAARRSTSQAIQARAVGRGLARQRSGSRCRATKHATPRQHRSSRSTSVRW